MNHQEHQEHQALSAEVDAVGRAIVDAGIKVHSALGPGLLESAYEHCLAHLLERQGCKVRRQVALPITFEGLRIDAGYRLDLLVDEQVIVEVKAVRGLDAASFGAGAHLPEARGA